MKTLKTLRRRLKARILIRLRRRTRRTAPSHTGPLRYAALLLGALILAGLAGCATQPSKSQHATIRAERITISDARAGAATELIRYAASNAVAPELLAELLAAIPGGDVAVISQAMANETGGSESYAATSTPTTSTPIDVMRGTGGGSTWGAFGAGLGALFDSIRGAPSVAGTGAACPDGDPNCADHPAP